MSAPVRGRRLGAWVVVVLIIGTALALLGTDRSGGALARNDHPVVTSVSGNPAQTSGTPPASTPPGAGGTTRPVALSAPQEQTAPGTTAYEVTIDGVERTFRVHPAVGADAAHPAPLLLVLPGWHLGARESETQTGFDTLSASAGVSIAYLDGQQTSWNAGTCCGFAVRAHLDDVDSLHSFVDAVAAIVPVDRLHVVLAGFSNGGMLAYRVACTQSAQLAGIIVGSGSLQIEPCAPGALSVVVGHGAADATVPVDGLVHSTYLNGPVTSQAVSLAPFLAADACATRTETQRADFTVTRLRDCTGGTTVDSYLDGTGGHAWIGTVPGGKSFSATAWQLLGGRPAREPFTP